jgi:solute carrier family 26, other
MTNLAACIVSIISILMLYLVKEQINNRFQKKMFMPVPIDLIVVIIGTVLSYFFNFNEKFGIQIVNYIPKGYLLNTKTKQTTLS